MNIYQTAIDVQDACNLSGVINSWKLCFQEINNEMQTAKAGDDFRRKHPVNILFLSKVSQMMGFNDPVDWVSYGKAYQICKEKAIAISQV